MELAQAVIDDDIGNSLYLRFDIFDPKLRAGQGKVGRGTEYRLPVVARQPANFGRIAMPPLRRTSKARRASRRMNSEVTDATLRYLFD